MFLLIIIIVALVAVAGAAAVAVIHENREPMRPSFEKISLQSPFRKESTESVSIVGNYWRGSRNRGVILLHMMPATKESWTKLATRLAEEGLHVLAIDLRGHGESVRTSSGSLLNYESFSDQNHQETIADVVGAADFLIKQGVRPEKLVIGGASIGANLALQFLSQHHETPSAFALSPGTNYRGINADTALDALGPDQRVLLIAAENDGYSAQSVKTVHAEHPKTTHVQIFLSGGHGTDLLTSHDKLSSTIIDFIFQKKEFSKILRPLFPVEFR